MTTLARFTPFGNGTLIPFSIGPLFKELENLVHEDGFGFRAPQSLAPPADIVETENDIVVTVDLPGHSAKDIQVELKDDILTIQSERKSKASDKGSNSVRLERFHGVFARSFVLPASVDGSKPEARYEDGVLTVTLPKREEAKPRVIEIKVK